MTSTAHLPHVYAPVTILMLYLTEECNLRCTYCFVEKKPRHMSSETMRKSIDFFLDRNVSGANHEISLTFFGGEPFTRLDLMEEAIAYARQRRPNVYKSVKFSATTNGTVASPRVERIIREARMSLLVSMDGGHGASAHRPFVSGRSSYELLARNLPRLVAWSPSVVVRMTFHPQSLDLVGNVRHALEIGAPSIALCPVEEAPWKGHEQTLEDAYQALADYYIAEARAGRILPLEITNRYLRLHHAALHGAPRPARPCGVGTNLIGVDPDGHVMPCHRFLYRPKDWLGTVDRPEMDEDRWKYVHLSSSDILGCDGCVAQPVCGGGCRAVALMSGRSLYDAHPGYCITTRAHVRAVHKIYNALTADGNAAFTRMLGSAGYQNAGLAELTSR